MESMINIVNKHNVRVLSKEKDITAKKPPASIRNEKRHSIFNTLIRQHDLETEDFNTYTNNKDDNYVYF